MAEFFNLRKRKLFYSGLNCYSVYVECADQPPIDAYASFNNCGKCMGKGHVEGETTVCAGCNGFGILLKLVRPQQLPPSSFHGVKDPGPGAS